MVSFKIKKSDMRIFMMCLLLFLALFRICLFSNQIFRAYSFIILGVLSLKVGKSIRRLRRNKWAILFGIVVALSVVYQSRSITSIFNACTYFLQFTIPFLVIDYLTICYDLKSVLKGLMCVSILVCLAMDVSVIIGMDIDKTHYQNLITYLLGNKFMVAYLHMQTIGLIAAYENISGRLMNIGTRLELLIYGIYGVALCSYVNCATGIVGNSIIIILIVFPLADTLKKILSKPLTMMMILLISNILVIGSDILLQVPLIQNLITNVLHKDLTLTGRLQIYALLPDLFRDHLIIGHGYNSDIFAKLIGYGNAQNGVLQYVLDCGIVGTAALIINWIYSILCIKNKEQVSWPLISVVYGFMICSLVEVCFKLNFILILAVVSGFRFIENENLNNRGMYDEIQSV